MNLALSGYKSYIVGAIMVLLGVLQDFNQELILQGLAVIALRAGIQKVQ